MPDTSAAPHRTPTEMQAWEIPPPIDMRVNSAGFHLNARLERELANFMRPIGRKYFINASPWPERERPGQGDFICYRADYLDSLARIRAFSSLISLTMWRRKSVIAGPWSCPNRPAPSTNPL
jgi:hypothetical protein